MRMGLSIPLTGTASQCRPGRRLLPLDGMCVAPAAPAGQRPKRSIDEDTEEADMPLVGIGHLTMLDKAPPDWVSLAHDAGFDAVGIRAAPIGPTEEEWPMRAGSPMLAETLRRMDDTGVRVLDAEIIRIDPQTVIAKYEPLFETAAALGASFLNVMGDDPELHRARDTFAALAEAARPYGLRPAIEAIPYMKVKTLSDAAVLVGESGGGIIIDPLHLQRSGGTPGDVRSLDPKLIAYCQLCDAPLAAPHNLPRPRELPRGQSVEGITDLALEARAVRLLPGDGELPLAEIISAVPAELPLSVEMPNLALLEALGAIEFTRRARQAVTRLLAVAAPAGGAGIAP
jgi:sugar phosphate isomerase/epimerase